MEYNCAFCISLYYCPVSLSLCLSALFSRITAAVSFPFTAHSSLNHKIHTLYIYTSSRSLAFFCSAKLNHYRSEIHYPANELLSRPPLINSNSSQPFRIVVYTPTHTQSYSVNQRVRILRSNLSGGGHPAESARAWVIARIHLDGIYTSSHYLARNSPRDPPSRVLLQPHIHTQSVIQKQRARVLVDLD